MSYNYNSDEEIERIITGICDNVITNRVSFNQAVAESEISNITFYKWLSKNEDMQKLYNYARSIRADILFEEIVDIADHQEEGEELTQEFDESGAIVKETKKKGDMFKQRQLKIDARKWVVAKMQPKKYGDKIDLTTDGQKLDSAVTIFQIPDDKRN